MGEGRLETNDGWEKRKEDDMERVKGYVKMKRGGRGEEGVKKKKKRDGWTLGTNGGWKRGKLKRKKKRMGES